MLLIFIQQGAAVEIVNLLYAHRADCNKDPSYIEGLVCLLYVEQENIFPDVDSEIGEALLGGVLTFPQQQECFHFYYVCRWMLAMRVQL